jgi:hypothetical protein
MAGAESPPLDGTRPWVPRDEPVLIPDLERGLRNSAGDRLTSERVSAELRRSASRTSIPSVGV